MKLSLVDPRSNHVSLAFRLESKASTLNSGHLNGFNGH